MKHFFCRNQYIDLMNMSRSSKRFGFFRRSGKELLPVEPVKDITILPWWIVQLGFVTEEDMKLADKAEVRSVKTISNGLLSRTLSLKPLTVS